MEKAVFKTKTKMIQFIIVMLLIGFSTQAQIYSD